MIMKKEKQSYLLIVIGLLLMTGSFFLEEVVQLPNLVKGLILGIGIGLIILFLVRKKRSKDMVV